MIKAILVDDERLSLDKLSRMLKETGIVDIVGEYQVPTGALDAVSQGMCDVVFLDIHMAQINGLQLADKFLQINSELTIVFVTAYDEYAIEAFELNALDYVLKPVKRERLQKTLDRITKQSLVSKKQSKLQVICFGGFRVIVKSVDGDEIKWRTSKAEELFAFLIHHADEPLSRNEIIDEMWGELASDKAVAYFHTTIHYIRKTLANSGIDGLIQQNKGFYRLDASSIDCDRYEFERLVKIITSAAGDADSALHADIASLYKGPYMGVKPYAWAEEMKMDLEQMYVHSLIQLCESYLKRNQYVAAEERLRQALKYYPTNERIQERLIEVYLLQHDRIAAMKQYDSFKRKLKIEYGVAPGQNVKNLLGIR